MKHYLLIDSDLGKPDKKAKIDYAKEIIQRSKEYLGTQLEFVTEASQADIFDVIGGDGYMLKSMRNYHQYGKPFFGINAGTLGFMLNDPKKIDYLPETLDHIDMYPVPIVPVTLTYQNGTQEEGIYINDIAIGSHIKHSFHFDVQGEDLPNDFSTHIYATGLIVNTPVGSTACGASLGQSPLPLRSKRRGIVPIAGRPFFYRTVIAQTLHIDVEGRYACDVALDGDNFVREDIASVLIRTPQTYTQLAFLNGMEFEEKRMLMGEKKAL